MSAAVLIHAGAGSFSGELTDREDEVRDVLLDVLTQARESLEGGGDAVEVAASAVERMESFELFNAGRGSALCSDGSVQMSAAIMRGRDRAAGAVAGIRRIEHPVRAALALLHSDTVLMVGEGAERWAVGQGLVLREAAFFVTERQTSRLAERLGPGHGTVGAVCLDGYGDLAAATSTGGILGQVPGRVGDSPLIGAGTWADARVAISCTGDGEAFIRAAVAHSIAARVQESMDVGAASDLALADVTGLGATGGLIALDQHGGLAMPFSTLAMPRGAWRAGGQPQVWIRSER